MAKTDCDYNRDLFDLPDACVWTQPMVECNPIGCKSRTASKTTRITTLPIARCIECDTDSEETLP